MSSAGFNDYYTPNEQRLIFASSSPGGGAPITVSWVIFGGAADIGPVSVSTGLGIELGLFGGAISASGSLVEYIHNALVGTREGSISPPFAVTKYFPLGAEQPMTYSAGQNVAHVIDKKGIAATLVVDWRTQLNSPRPQAFMAAAPGNETIFGGTRAETLFGGTGQDLTFIDGSKTTQGADIVAAGSGNETLNAGSAKSGVDMAIGSGSVDLIGSAAGDTIFGGSGDATITTNGGSDLFVFGSTAGGVGGTDLITDFNPAKDSIFLSGVTVASETEAGTSPAMITLSDGTRLTFTGIADPTTIRIT